MSSAGCSDLDPEVIAQAKLYYYELLSSVSEQYNAFHRIIYQFLCIVGVIANICVVVVLLRPAMRKNPFNLFLIAIAICDMSLMASYFVYKQVEMCHPWYFTFSWIVYTKGYAVLSVFVHSASLWMTVNMAVLRYLVLRSGASSSRHWPRLNTYKVASVSVAVAVLVAAVGSAPNMLRYEIRDNGKVDVPKFCVEKGAPYASMYGPGAQVHAYTLGQPRFWSCAWERFSFWTAGLLLKLVPCLLLTVFMTLLVRMLVEARERRSRLIMKQPPKSVGGFSTNHNGGQEMTGKPEKGGGGTSKTQAERTTAMLTIIVAVFLITELPQGILVVAIGVRPQVRFAMHQLSNIIDLLSLLNSSVNFILYATMSNLFRHEFLHTFGGCCPKRVADWLQGRSGGTNGQENSREKPSPPPGTQLCMEPGTLVTAMNGTSKLIRPSPGHSEGPSPAKLAETGRQIGSIAKRGINGNSSHRISKKMVANQQNCDRMLKPSECRSDDSLLLIHDDDGDQKL